jgi:hypothetical protein
MAATPNNDPLFIGKIIHWDAELTNQVFPRTGGAVNTSLVPLGTAGDNGGVISSISVQVTGDTGSSNVVVLFTVRDGQSTARKRIEATLPQVSGSSTTTVIANYPVSVTLTDEEPFEGAIVELLKLEPREALYCALLQAETTSRFIVHAVGGLYDRA